MKALQKNVENLEKEYIPDVTLNLTLDKTSELIRKLFQSEEIDSVEGK